MNLIIIVLYHLSTSYINCLGCHIHVHSIQMVSKAPKPGLACMSRNIFLISALC